MQSMRERAWRIVLGIGRSRAAGMRIGESIGVRTVHDMLRMAEPLRSAQHGAPQMLVAILFLAAATASATIITADIGNSRQLHLHAAHTIETPLPSFSDALALVVAGAGCDAFIKPEPPPRKPFALLARRVLLCVRGRLARRRVTISDAATRTF